MKLPLNFQLVSLQLQRNVKAFAEVYCLLFTALFQNQPNGVFFLVYIGQVEESPLMKKLRERSKRGTVLPRAVDHYYTHCIHLICCCYSDNYTPASR